MVTRKNTQVIEELIQGTAYNIYDSDLRLLDEEVEFYKV
jgi:hypothetical protein